jgi:hypothetical protein
MELLERVEAVGHGVGKRSMDGECWSVPLVGYSRRPVK